MVVGIGHATGAPQAGCSACREGVVDNRNSHQTVQCPNSNVGRPMGYWRQVRKPEMPVVLAPTPVVLARNGDFSSSGV